MRVFLPATLTTVRSLRSPGGTAGGIVAERGHAVTVALRERFPDADDEELAYEAYRNAARESLELLGGDPAAPRRRVVVAADVLVDTSTGDSAVVLPGPVSLSAVAALHVDGPGAERDVAAAAAALPAAAAGETDAQRAVARTEEHELEWYDVSELDQLLAG